MLASGELTRWWSLIVLVGTVALAIVAARGTGETPFRAAIALAVLTAATLVVNSWS